VNELRRGTTRTIGLALNLLAVVLLLLGVALGWVVPALPGGALPPGLGLFAEPLAAAHLDAGSYLGADITALAVIVAVVIGFNVTILQIAGQAHSLRLVRGLLATLSPFVLCWSAATGVALGYFLVPPVFVGQLWQQMAWFAAVVVLMIAYLWDLPWRLSGNYVARWALAGLRKRPAADWEAIEGYSVLQTAIVAAVGRGDLGTVRAIALTLGRFLVAAPDRAAVAANRYDRSRYRALKGLLSGAAQGVGQAPTAAAYYLGYVQAGVLLLAIAGGQPVDDPDKDLFTGLLRAVRGAPDHVNPLWTGLRHALCRPTDRGVAYLLDYWRRYTSWPADDPRRVGRVATALARFHGACWAELAGSAPAAAAEQAAEMAGDLYRDLARHLGPAAAQAHGRAADLPLLPLMLLDATHAAVIAAWPADGPREALARVAVVNAYEEQRAALGAALGASLGAAVSPAAV
jgi:hypothetical protein